MDAQLRALQASSARLRELVEQLDLGDPVFDLDRAHQAHVDDRDPLLLAAGIIDSGERVACPRWQLGHTVIVSPAGTRWQDL